MFARASRQTLQREAYSHEALQLPFLCPALYRSGSRRVRRKSSTAQPIHSTPSSRPCGTSQSLLSRKNTQSVQRRSHASAVALATEPHLSEYIPWANTTSNSLSASDKHATSALYPPLLGIDAASSPLIVKDAPITSGKFRIFDAISGDTHEIHQTLHACLQVERYDRAAALVRRLGQLYKRDAPGLLAAHNDYIREITLVLLRSRFPSLRLLQNLHHWFEVELRGTGITPNAVTYALMIQASFKSPDKKQGSRAVRRYVHLAQNAGLGDETMALVSGLEETAHVCSCDTMHTSHIC